MEVLHMIIIILLYSIVLFHNRITTGANLLQPLQMQPAPAGGIFSAFCFIVTRLNGHIRVFIAYPYIIPFKHKNDLKRQIMPLYGHIRRPDQSRPKRKTPTPRTPRRPARICGKNTANTIYCGIDFATPIYCG